MLYTSYLAKLKNLPDEGRKIIIMRWVPKYIDISKYDLEWDPRLAPSELLLSQYKEKSISFQEFTRRFKEEMQIRPDYNEACKDIKQSLDAGEDVYIICCEKDPFECHRTLIKDDIEAEGYKCREW